MIYQKRSSSGNSTLFRRVAIALPATGEEEWQAVREPLTSGWLTQGPKVAEFEQAFASRHSVSRALATTSCTTALHLILAAMGIGPGDEVIVPSFTWIATANVVLYCGGTPILADVDPTTFNLDPEDVAKRLTTRTKAIIAVHLFGLPADIDALRAVIGRDMPIIEDAACASGAAYKGRPAGSLGLAAAFSFHPRKSITTGEGGMVTTNDQGLADVADMLRNHGASISEEQRHHGPQPYIMADFNLLGFNYRMTDIQAAIGAVQLRKLDQFVDERARWARWYREELSDIAWLRCPQEPNDGRHAWQSFVTLVDPARAPMPRNEIMARLHAEGVATRPGSHAVHTLGYYAKRFDYKPNDLPGARNSYENSMAIPLHNRMTHEDYQYVSDALHRIGR